MTQQEYEQVLTVRCILLSSAGKLPFPKELFMEMVPGRVVHAGRGTGKTPALLWAVSEREAGNAIIAAPDVRAAENLVNEYRARNYAGDPQFVTARQVLGVVMGCDLPVYCDEFMSYPEYVRRDLSMCRNSVIAIGTGSIKADGRPIEVGIRTYPLWRLE